MANLEEPMDETKMKILSLFDGDEWISRVNLATKLHMGLNEVQDHLDWLHVCGFITQKENFYRMTKGGHKWYWEEVEKNS